MEAAAVQKCEAGRQGLNAQGLVPSSVRGKHTKYNQQGTHTRFD